MNDRATRPGPGADTKNGTGAGTEPGANQAARAGKTSRKELLRAFKATPDVGGVYAIRNRETGRTLIQATTTISKAEGILSFAKLTGSCVHPLIADDWKAYGADAFELEILETLERKESETLPEFTEEIRALGELWEERFGKGMRY